MTLAKTSSAMFAAICLAACSGSDEPKGESMCSERPDGTWRCVDCTPKLEAVGLDEMTGAGVPSERIDQAGGMRTGSLEWLGGGGVVAVTPDSGITMFEAELTYAGAVYIDQGDCSMGQLLVDSELRLSSDDGAFSEVFPVQAIADPHATGLRVDMEIVDGDVTGTFDVAVGDPMFPNIVTTLRATFTADAASGEIEAAATMEEEELPDGGMSGGGPAPVIVATFGTAAG